MGPYRAQLPNARVVGDNIYARFNRKVKVERLVAAIDQHARDIDLDPFANAAAVLRSVVDLLDERGWEGVADEAGCKVPSQTTIQLVRKEYEERAAGRRNGTEEN